MSMPQSHDMNLRAIKQFFDIDTLSMTISTKFQVLNPDHLGDRASRSAQPYYRLGKSQNVQFLDWYPAGDIDISQPFRHFER